MGVVEFSSTELALEDHTVPSRTEHEFLAEGIEDKYNHEVTRIQIAIYDGLQKLYELLEKARAQKSLGTNGEEKKLVRQIKNLRDAKTRAINRFQQLRESQYEALHKWEIFGAGVVEDGKME